MHRPERRGAGASCAAPRSRPVDSPSQDEPGLFLDQDTEPRCTGKSLIEDMAATPPPCLNGTQQQDCFFGPLVARPLSTIGPPVECCQGGGIPHSGKDQPDPLEARH